MPTELGKMYTDRGGMTLSPSGRMIDNAPQTYGSRQDFATAFNQPGYFGYTPPKPRALPAAQTPGMIADLNSITDQRRFDAAQLAAPAAPKLTIADLFAAPTKEPEYLSYRAQQTQPRLKVTIGGRAGVGTPPAPGFAGRSDRGASGVSNGGGITGGAGGSYGLGGPGGMAGRRNNGLG